MLHYPVLTALRTNSLSLECPFLPEEVISLCLARLHFTVSLIHGLDLLRAWDKVCDTPPLGHVQGDLYSPCHHFAEFEEPWWATAGAVPALCSGAWLHQTQTLCGFAGTNLQTYLAWGLWVVPRGGSGCPWVVMRWHWQGLRLPVEGRRYPRALAHEKCSRC